MDKSDFRIDTELKKDIRKSAIKKHLTYAQYCRKAIQKGHMELKIN